MRADSIHDCRQRSAHQASPRLKKRRNLETLSTDGSAAPLTGRPAASSVRVRPRACDSSPLDRNDFGVARQAVDEGEGTGRVRKHRASLLEEQNWW